MLALARSVHNTAHHGNLEFFDAWVLFTPDRHLRSQEIINLLGEFLKGGAGGTSTPWASRDARHEGPQAQCLENLQGDDDFLSAGLFRGGRQRDANRVANALLQQDGQGSG